MLGEMRRPKQLLSKEDTEAVFERGTSGVLSVNGLDGYPYSVPVNYVYTDGHIYIHTGLTGYKVEAIKANNLVSFCVIDRDTIIPEELTSYFRSAVAFGKAVFLEGQEKYDATYILANKFSPVFQDKIQLCLDTTLDKMHLIDIQIDQMYGKEAIELVNEKENN